MITREQSVISKFSNVFDMQFVPNRKRGLSTSLRMRW